MTNRRTRGPHLSASQREEKHGEADYLWRQDHRKSRVNGLAEQIGREPLPCRSAEELNREQEEHRESRRRVWQRSFDSYRGSHPWARRVSRSKYSPNVCDRRRREKAAA